MLIHTRCHFYFSIQCVNKKIFNSKQSHHLKTIFISRNPNAFYQRTFMVPRSLDRLKRRVSFDRLIIRTIDAEPMNIFCYSLSKHEPLDVTDVHTRKIS